MSLAINIPYWGSAEHLKIAVESVRSQHDERWQLTIIDDAYPDDAARVWLESLRDPRIRYLRNSSNLGVSANFNRALEVGDGDDVVILGCDDAVEPTFVGTMLALREAFPTAAMLHGGVRVMDENGQPFRPLADRIKAILRPSLEHPMELQGERLATSLLRGNWLYFPAIVWKRSVVKDIGFATEFGVVQDLHAIMRLILGGHSLALTDEPALVYRRHSASVSSAAGVNGLRFLEEKALFAWVASEAGSRGWRRARRAARAHLMTRMHAAATVPAALQQRDLKGAAQLVSIAFGHLTQTPGQEGKK